MRITFERISWKVMERSLSRSQVDRLGERLKTGAYPESDLRLLDEYRRSFGEAYEEVIRVLHRLGLAPTGRPAKSTQSIVDKLQRESIVDELREEIDTMSAQPQGDVELREKKRKLDELTLVLKISEEKEQETRRKLSDFWDVITHTLKSTASWLETQRQEE